MKCFAQIEGLPELVLTSLKRMEFNKPTPIQVQSIPLALAGRDILGSAQTGTGKTAAFAIPLVSKIITGEIESALVLTPTRELAVQVLSQIHAILGRTSKINTALLIGGEAMPNQYRQLRRKPQIVVGTPGRINDHLERGSVDFSNIGFLVLDETDRMLDMGFGKQIDTILDYFPEEKAQTLMFSATMPKDIMKMAAKYLENPERIQIGSSLKPLEAIDQKNAYVEDDEKYDRLLQEIDEREGSIIVFVKTKFGAKRIADRLYRDNCKADAIHGNLRQSRRDSVLRQFRNNRFRVLVATDVAARGLDVPHIQHVVNFDLPQCPEDYIHRVGRTARAGAKGNALNFISGREKRLWKAIERFMKTGDQAEQRGGRSGGNSRSGDRSRSRNFRSGAKKCGYSHSRRGDSAESGFSSSKGGRRSGGGGRGKGRSNSTGRAFGKKRSSSSCQYRSGASSSSRAN